MFYVGTSGYSYDDWVGPFYPPGTPKNAFLAFYASRFACVEVNYTYYTMPSARTLEAMCRSAGPALRFVIKAPGEITHERPAQGDPMQQFRDALAPVIAADRLGAVLAQFPPSFQPGDPSREVLLRLRQGLEGLPVVIEFRHALWARPATFDLLRSLGLGYCCVDEPRLTGLMPPFAEVTGGTGYVRFHGRNAAHWHQHQHAWQRYNYLYSREELAEWVPKARRIADQAPVAYAFFNNHYSAQATQNAGLFIELLEEAGIEVAGL